VKREEKAGRADWLILYVTVVVVGCYYVVPFLYTHILLWFGSWLLRLFAFVCGLVHLLLTPFCPIVFISMKIKIGAGMKGKHKAAKVARRTALVALKGGAAAASGGRRRRLRAGAGVVTHQAAGGMAAKQT
jgi:hypothetical protein